MLNEPGGIAEAAVVSTPTPADTLQAALRAAVDRVFTVEIEYGVLPPLVAATYVGKLQIDSAAAYVELDRAFGQLGFIPVFRAEGDKHVIRAVRRYARPAPRPWWPNALMLALTILSLLYTGMTIQLQRIDLTSPLDLLYGWPYALGLMLILGAHEMGHYLAARRHGVAVSLPYFIPLPLVGSLGTLGAFIQLREPVRDRRVLLDIGAAGPLIGMVFAIPILLIGLATSPVKPLPLLDLFTLKASTLSYAIEGNSLLYAGAKLLVFGRFLPNPMQDVFINQLAQAGWTGLLITALNLIPLGQLDGGHVVFSLIGVRARSLYLPLMIALGLLAVLYPGWLLWAFLLLLLGRVYATPLDMITTLNRRRVMLGILALIVFVLVFAPIPFQEVLFGA
jgi:membrane-associated protease RseP (regulator of RpoE activity)